MKWTVDYMLSDMSHSIRIDHELLLVLILGRLRGTTPSFSQKNEIWNVQLFSLGGC